MFRIYNATKARNTARLAELVNKNSQLKREVKELERIREEQASYIRKLEASHSSFSFRMDLRSGIIEVGGDK